MKIKNIILSLAVLTICTVFTLNTFAQAPARFTKVYYENFKTKQLLNGSGIERRFSGTLVDADENVYVWGEFESYYKNPDINLTFNSYDKFIIKYDKSHKAVWGVNLTSRVNVIHLEFGPDSLLYIFVCKLDGYANVTIGGLKLTAPSAGGAECSFMFAINPDDGKAVRGLVFGSGVPKYHRTILGHTWDENKNLYVTLLCNLVNWTKPDDSLRFFPLAAKLTGQFNNIVILKYNTKLEPVWMHVIAECYQQNMAYMDYYKGSVVVCGDVGYSVHEYMDSTFLDNELFTVLKPFPPNRNLSIPYMIKYDTTGKKVFQQTFIGKKTNDDADGGLIYDMLMDHEGNIIMHLVNKDSIQMVLIDGVWTTFKVNRTYDKILKFDNNGKLLWICEPFLNNLTSVQPEMYGTNRRKMQIDQYGNVYVTSAFMQNGFIKLDDLYFDWGFTSGTSQTQSGFILKIDKFGKAADIMTLPVRTYKLAQYYPVFYSYVRPDGKIFYPFQLALQDTFQVLGKDTLKRDLTYFMNNFLVFSEVQMKLHNSATVKNPCSGSSNGFIHLGITGGDLKYTIKWAHGPTTANLDNLAAGTYMVSISDGEGSTIKDTFELSAGPPIVSGASINHDVNNKGYGSITTNVKGGTPPYTYKWNDPAKSTTPDIQDLFAGAYKLTITDANGCVWDTTITVKNTGSIPEQAYNLKVFPNPVSNHTLNISLSKLSTDELKISVYDLAGKQVFRKNYRIQGSTFNESIPFNYPQGSYLIKIQAGKEVMWRKIEVAGN